MFTTNYLFGTGDVHYHCLQHVNKMMLMFVKGYKDFWDNAKLAGSRETFGSYLEGVSPKRICVGKERVALYNSLIKLLESPNEEELTIEHEYVLFHILDEYVENGGGPVPYVVSQVDDDHLTDIPCVYPNVWRVENAEVRNLIVKDMEERAMEILEENCAEEVGNFDAIFTSLMSHVEDISEYRILLDDTDFELYDKIPNIRAI